MYDPLAPRLSVPRRAFLALGLGGLGALLVGGGGFAYALQRLNEIERFGRDDLSRLRAGRSNPLLERYPALADRLPWRPLGEFPTPVEEMASPSTTAGVRLFVKRDDLSSSLYGGNKVRKLEHFLAEAELGGRRTLITVGSLGSNHGLATAVHGAALGFQTDLALFDQPLSEYVRRNLGGFLHAGARLHYAGSTSAALLVARRLHLRRTREGERPYFLMPGGTSRLGTIGHVSAGLELAEQVRAGVLPEPDRIFVPLGTCGTAAGLLVGLRLAGLRSRLVAVRVADPFPASAYVLRFFAESAASYLHESDPALPLVRVGAEDFEVLSEYLGSGYGYPTTAGEAAIRAARPQLRLEPTYSAKALAACLDYCRRRSEPATVLFWNTYNSAPVAASASWEGLPPALRRMVRT